MKNNIKINHNVIILLLEIAILIIEVVMKQ